MLDEQAHEQREWAVKANEQSEWADFVSDKVSQRATWNSKNPIFQDAKSGEVNKVRWSPTFFHSAFVSLSHS